MDIHIMVREEQCTILQHMVTVGHRISAITLMGISPEVILSKVE